MIREFFGKIKAAFQARAARVDVRQPRPRAVADVHPGIRRRIEKKLGRRIERNAVLMLTPEDEAAFAAVAIVRARVRIARRAAKRVTGGVSGNAHQRRKARRAYRAHEWYMRTLQARAAA